MKRLFAVVVALMAACGPLPLEAQPSKTWVTKDLVANARQDKNFGGISSRMLAVQTGDVIPWRSAVYEGGSEVRQGEGPGLPLWPAFADGRTASMLITEVWLNHPTPWVQPVYGFRTDGSARTDLRSVFAVGTDSTFYTPYWRSEAATVPAETKLDTFTSVVSILDAKVPVQEGAVVVCPIVPSDVNVAMGAAESFATRPLSRETVPTPSKVEAWVDGVVVNYLAIGTNKQPVTENALPIETPMYFWAKQTLPPILPNDPTKHSFHRRYEIPLSSSFGVFVSADHPALAEQLKAQGAPVPDVDPAISQQLAAAYLLRVATNPSCFSKAADFPTGCRWVDSQSAVEDAIAQDLRVRTQTIITASTLQVGER